MTIKEFTTKYPISIKSEITSLKNETFKESDGFICDLEFDNRTMQQVYYKGIGLRVIRNPTSVFREDYETSKHKMYNSKYYKEMFIKCTQPVKPTVEEVLECLKMDVEGLEDCVFEEWAENYGYSSDSREAERIYNACKEEKTKLNKFLGRTAYRDLIYEVTEED